MFAYLGGNHSGNIFRYSGSLKYLTLVRVHIIYIYLVYLLSSDLKYVLIFEFPKRKNCFKMAIFGLGPVFHPEALLAPPKGA